MGDTVGTEESFSEINMIETENSLTVDKLETGNSSETCKGEKETSFERGLGLMIGEEIPHPFKVMAGVI